MTYILYIAKININVIWDVCLSIDLLRL